MNQNLIGSSKLLLFDEKVQGLIEIPPHIRIETNVRYASGRIWGLVTLRLGPSQSQTINDRIFQKKELAHEKSDAVHYPDIFVPNCKQQLEAEK